jgi:hypothetical protein
MDRDDTYASDPEYHAAGYPGYFNTLAPEEEEEFEIDGWSGFDEVLDADKPISKEEMIRQLEEMIAPGKDSYGL